MGILETLWRNLASPVRTQPPSGLPATPQRFRGALTHDATRCTACGTCAYVCAPKAIRFEEHTDQSVSWTFFIGQCSFCGLCEQNCPTSAIGNTAELPVTALGAENGGLRLESRIARVPCTRCGKLHAPLPVDMQTKLGHGSATDAPPAEQGYCPECRGHAFSQRLRDAFLSPAKPRTNGEGDVT